MAATLTVFYRDGLKRGPPAESATFGQWLAEPKAGPLLPGARRLVALPIGRQTGNAYVLHPITRPLDPSSRFVTIKVSVPDLPGFAWAGSTEVGLNDGTSAEIWV